MNTDAPTLVKVSLYEVFTSFYQTNRSHSENNTGSQTPYEEEMTSAFPPKPERFDLRIFSFKLHRNGGFVNEKPLYNRTHYRDP